VRYNTFRSGFDRFLVRGSCLALFGLVLFLTPGSGPATAQSPMSPAAARLKTSGGSSGGDRVIHFWYSLPQVEAGPLEALLSRFNQTHARGTMEGRNFSTMDELHTALSSGSELPNLALIDSTWQSELITAKRIVPAEELLDKMGTMARIIHKADTFPCMWEAVQVDGRCWTLPAFATSHALVYDLERLQQAGIKVPPKNWYEIALAGRKLSNPSQHQWGFLVPTESMSARDAGRLFEIYRMQAGAAAPSAGDVATWLDGPECVQVLQHWLDLVHKHKVSPATSGESLDNAAMFIGTLRDLLDAQAKGRRVQAVPLPAFKTQAADLSLYTVAIFNCEDHSALDRHWEAALWLTEFQQMLEYSLVAGYIPANKQITLSPGYFQYLQAHPGIRSFLAQLRNCHVDPMVPNYAAALDILGEALKKAIESNGGAQEALTGARQKAEAVVKQETVPQPRSTPTGG
jgi:ABC-type glycerol-3-phosphate transport system substrate-binding protein